MVIPPVYCANHEWIVWVFGDRLLRRYLTSRAGRPNAVTTTQQRYYERMFITVWARFGEIGVAQCDNLCPQPLFSSKGAVGFGQLAMQFR